MLSIQLRLTLTISTYSKEGTNKESITYLRSINMVTKHTIKEDLGIVFALT